VSGQSKMDIYFKGFGARLSELTRARGVAVDLPNIKPSLAHEVLDLAGAVAHTQERQFAPLASFLAGVAVGTLRSAGELGADREVATFIATLRRHLEDPDDPAKDE
jgi:hypothetical protein